METITKQHQTKEEILLHLIQDFFDCRKLSQHLLFLEYWMEKVLFNRRHKKQLKPADLHFFSLKFLKLLAACDEINSISGENILYFEESIKIPENYINEEQNSLSFYPNYLRTKEICNPLLVLRSIFKTHTLDFYAFTLQSWISEGLSDDTESENTKLIFPTYKQLKRMVEACWLIHERSISKNSYRLVHSNVKNFDFHFSCPLLLTEECLNNPYLFVESFFSFASIDEYREDLIRWFKAAMNEHQQYENASDLLFIHNQFTQLLHAGYLIGIAHLVYQPGHNYTKQHDTFGHWLLARMENQYTIQTLSPHFAANPLQYCTEHLTLNHIIKVRYGLKEWLEASLSKNSSITSLDHPYVFDQFEDLQKILEALFLLIVQPAVAD